MLKEFREFVARGNMIDLAVGVIVGGAFGKIVTSLVNDVVMPPIGVLLARVDFRHLSIRLAEAVDGRPVTLNYGAFVSNVLDFLLIAFVVFMVVKGINKLRRGAPVPVDRRECPFCLSQIPLKARRCAQCTSEVTPA